MFLKNYYSLNKSKTKHVLTALTLEDEKYTGVINIFGDKTGITLSIEQYMKLFYNRGEIYKFFDDKEYKLCVELNDEKRFCNVQGKYDLILFNEVDRKSKYVSCLFIAKCTFDKLMELQPLIFHNLSLLQLNIVEINEFCANVRKRQANGTFQISEFKRYKDGLDYAKLAMEMISYTDGVEDALF